MDTVGEIKSAVTKLSREELSAFRNWFQEYDSDAWDKEIEEDVAEGRLDAIAEQAMRDLDKYIKRIFWKTTPMANMIAALNSSKNYSKL